jgi:hypothetical protein
MPQLRITVGEVDLDLPADVAISVELNNPLLGDEQPGSLSFPFKVPVTPRNADALGLAHLPGVQAERRREFDCTVSCGPLFFSGKLQARESGNRSLSCNLVIPPANVPATVWQQKLRTLDLGHYQFATVETPTNLFSVLIPETLLKLGPDRGSTTLTLLLDGSPFWDFTVSRLTGDTDPILSNEALLAAAADSFNDKLKSFPADPKPYVATASGASLTWQINDANRLGNTYQLRITRSGTSTAGRPRSSEITLPVPRISLPLFDIANQALRLDGVFESPMLRNEGLYDSEKNKNFSGFVNFYDPEAPFPLLNDTANPTRYSLMPLLYFRFVLTEVAKRIGFALDPGLLGSDADLRWLLLTHNSPLDRQAPGLGLPFNCWNPRFEYNTALPDWTVKQLFDELKLFAARVLWDAPTQTARVVLLRDVLTAPTALDWNDRLLYDYTLDPGDEQPRRLKFALDSTNALEKDTEPQFDSYPAKAVATAPDGRDFRDLEVALASWLQPVTVTYRDTSGTSSNYTRPGTPVDTSTLVPVYTRAIAQAKQPGRSPLFGQQDAPLAAPRLLFFTFRVMPESTTGENGLGTATISQSAYNEDFNNTPDSTLIRPTADASTERLALQWAGPTGLYENFWKPYLTFLNGTFAWRPYLLLNELDIARLRWDDKVIVGNRACLIAQLRFELTIDGIRKPVGATLNPV